MLTKQNLFNKQMEILMSTLPQTAKTDFNKAASSFKDAADETKRSVREVAEEAGTKVREFVNKNSEKVSELRHTAEDKINENPMKSVAIAAFAGLVLGALLRR
jgi:ElaB/YqjD/DUF883 family membrane-anchored ribosome-binding protein